MMLLIYLAVLLLLGVVRLYYWHRASRLEKKYVHLSKEAKKLANQPQYRAGNGNKPRDTYQHAKQQYELGRLVEKRDQVEQKYTRWQAGSDALGKKWSALTTWKGKVTPYFFGIVDAVILIMLVQMLTTWAPATPEYWEQTLSKL